MDQDLLNGEGAGATPVSRASGVIAATITPYSQNGGLNIEAASRLYEHLFHHGAQGVFIASSTGEADMLGAVQRAALVRAARAVAPEGRMVYVGTSSTGIDATVELANELGGSGADCAVVMAPAFLKYSQAELVDYFSRIADHSVTPIALYHHPRATNPLEVSSVALLAGHPNIIAIKDTSSTAARASRLLEATSGLDIAVLQGSENLMLESLQQGARGSVTALAGVVPDWHAALFDAWQRGDLPAAYAEQERLTRLWGMFGIESVGSTITNFTTALRIGLRRRGWLAESPNLLKGSGASPAMTAAIEAYYDEAGFSAGVRFHAAHSAPPVPSAVENSKSVVARGR